MADDTPEVVLDAIDGIYMWRARKPGMTLFGSYVGRLMLTSQRFLFLSSGVSGVGKALLVTAIGGPLAGLTLGQTTTDQLDLSALRNETSVSGRLQFITSARVRRRWDFSTYLTIDTAGTHSLPPVSAYMTRYGRNGAALLRFLHALDAARAVQSR
jgi:hypothetical protein